MLGLGCEGLWCEELWCAGLGAEGRLVGGGEEHRHDGARVRPRQLGGEGGCAAQRVLKVAQPGVGLGLG